jgi:hypothetical protein
MAGGSSSGGVTNGGEQPRDGRSWSSLQVAVVGLSAAVGVLLVLLVVLLLKSDEGDTEPVETATPESTTTSTTTIPRSTTTSTTTTTLATTTAPPPAPTTQLAPAGPSEAVVGWAAMYSQYRTEGAALQAPVGATLPEVQRTCQQGLELQARWRPLLIPAPDPILSGDASEYFSAAEQVSTLCLEAPWILERDRSSVDRRDAAHFRIVDQLYLLGATYTGP